MLWYALGFSIGLSLIAAYLLKKNREADPDGEALDWDANPRDTLSATLRERFTRF